MNDNRNQPRGLDVTLNNAFLLVAVRGAVLRLNIDWRKTGNYGSPWRIVYASDNRDEITGALDAWFAKYANLIADRAPGPIAGPETRPPVYPCDICPAEFDTELQLDVHRATAANHGGAADPRADTPAPADVERDENKILAGIDTAIAALERLGALKKAGKDLGL